MSDMTQISTLSGNTSFSAYVARPEGTPKAAIIVIQEIFGVNPGIRQKCDTWAEAGYLAVAPDLFWRMEAGIEINPDIPEQMDRAMELFGRYDPDDGVKDSPEDHLRRMQELCRDEDLKGSRP